ncbi:universal stress protein [Spongiimicrobium sp. 3-5]|uniref:universal stress protein n=1 Tax=Spongiimicrobium sp. 3-5 TaxID=3332596 RepID=UPI0039810903
MKKILIPTDFSENAMNAVNYAVSFFKYQKCEIFFLHAYADELYNATVLLSRELFEKHKEKMATETEKSLKELSSAVREAFPNPRHTYHTLSVFGSLVDAANDFINKENADIVVMGTKGKTNNKALTFGSHTLQVLKYVQCPVLAIPHRYSYQPPKKMLFPTDYMLPYKRRELKLVCEMAWSYRSEIHCLHISDYKRLSLRQEDNKRFLEDSMQKATLIFKTLPNGTRAKAIMDYIDQHKIEMLIMVNSRHSYMENMLYQSTIDKIGLNIEVPFLVMQNLIR